MPIQPYVRTGLAIVNKYGGIWTDEVFDGPEKAIAYLKEYWKDKYDPHAWRLVQATATIEPYTTPTEPTTYKVSDYKV